MSPIDLVMTDTRRVLKPLCANTSRRTVLKGLGATLPALALPACRSSAEGFDAQVIVMGAGLAGLNAAMWLAEEGWDVLVLEGSDRIGGRLHTLDHGRLGRTEAGGEQIGASYARVRDRAHALGIELVADDAPPRATLHVLRGRLYTPETWAADNPAGLPDPHAGSTPGAALFRAAAASNPFAGPEDWAGAVDDPALGELLEAAGMGEAQRGVLGHALNGNDLGSYSAANLWRSLQLYAQSRGMGPSLSVRDGAQSLPEAMAASLPRPVRMGARIARIDADASRVTVACADGTTVLAPYAVCALPFGALRHVELNAPTLPAQREAISSLPYTQIVQLHFAATRPFWEEDGLPADMWTDTPFERVFMQRGPDGEPTGLGRCWINGGGAAEVDLARFETAMAAVRPSMAGAVRPLAQVRWTGGDPLSGGAYMHFAPGQIARWADVMGRPAERLHFAGEHLGRLHTGMEAAMESGERAAFALMGL